MWELWNSGPIRSWGNFGTLGPYVHGGTLELWAHTFMGELWNSGPIRSWGNFGALGPYVHGGLWNSGPIRLGFCKLCWHKFEHYRDVPAFENNASIIGLFFEALLDQLYICSQNLNLLQAGDFL